MSDIRTIAYRFNLYPGRLDDDDITSVIKRIEADAHSDEFNVFVPAHALSGDGLMEVKISVGAAFKVDQQDLPGVVRSSCGDSGSLPSADLFDSVMAARLEHNGLEWTPFG
ncbi:hypothetical protein Y032_0018g3660 [Ancylostoma ceylanicum]|uniref:Uncharacterized protein n=1 Tax=Ancylostoma ceylanicum TaxID=53326 RepID=A0A016V444_9BILA|nr:hypothetical protein Y032_0018g3660 [Ancylostoma ceylanicum]